jgi:hypothetical protein
MRVGEKWGEICRGLARGAVAVAALQLAALGSFEARAASNDEIQVYDDAINKPGEWGLDTHLNYVASGITVPAWPGDAPSNHSFRATPELSYGVDGRWELGAYLPLLRTGSGANDIEGGKVRVKYMAPSDGGAFYWGINQELGWVSLRSAEQHWNVEIRPILGYRTGCWNLTLNPIIGIELNGPNGEIPDFSPAVRASCALGKTFSLGVEHYAGLGKLEHISPWAQQSQNTYLVMDTELAGYAINFGVGKGWNASSDRWTVKAIIGARF